MRLRACLLLAVLAATLHMATASAQEAKLRVSVNHSGDDTIGQRLAFALREVIRGSSGYQLAQAREAVLRINLVTLDPERSPSASGYWTAAAVSYTMRNDLPFDDKNPQTWYPIHMSTSVVIAGSSRVEEQAKGILAGLDREVEEYRKAMGAR